MSNFSDRLKQFIESAQVAHGKNGRKASIRKLSRMVDEEISHTAISAWLKGEVDYLKPENIKLLEKIDPENRSAFEINDFLINGPDSQESIEKKIQWHREQLQALMSISAA